MKSDDKNKRLFDHETINLRSRTETEKMEIDISSISKEMLETFSKLTDNVLNLKFALPMIEGHLKDYKRNPNIQTLKSYQQEVLTYGQSYLNIRKATRKLDSILSNLTFIQKLLHEFESSSIPEIYKILGYLDQNPDNIINSSSNRYDQNKRKIEFQHAELIKQVKEMRDAFKHLIEY